MSNGYAAAVEQVISIEDINKVCPDEWNLFFNLCEKNIKGGWKEYIRAEYHEDEPELLDNNAEFDYDNLNNIFTNLFTAFDEKTGLRLNWGYHNSDYQGDCYDDLNGSYFSVDGVYTESSEYVKAKKQFGITVEEKRFVIYG
jgi:hypothetical protein